MGVGPTFPLSPVALASSMRVDGQQPCETGTEVLAIRPQSSGRQGTADEPGVTCDAAVTYDIADGDEERFADLVWSTDWSRIPASPLEAKAKAARRRRSRKKKLGGQSTSPVDSKLHEGSSGITDGRTCGKCLGTTKPAAPSTPRRVSEAPNRDSWHTTDDSSDLDVARSASGPAMQRQGSQIGISSSVSGEEKDTQWYRLETP